jgi:B9 domain-containing protein 1
MTGLNPAIFNEPVQVTFTSPSPFGWPQIVVAVYGPNLFGNDKVVGYGATHIPTIMGSHHIDIPLFTPEPETLLQRVTTFFTGLYPELVDGDMVAKGTERECLHTRSQGTVRVTLDVVIHNPEVLALQLAPTLS